MDNKPVAGLWRLLQNLTPQHAVLAGLQASIGSDPSQAGAWGAERHAGPQTFKCLCWSSVACDSPLEDRPMLNLAALLHSNKTIRSDMSCTLHWFQLQICQTPCLPVTGVHLHAGGHIW